MNIKNELYQIKLLNNLLNIISRKRKRQIILCLLLAIISGFAELLTISLVVPFLTFFS